MLVEFTINNLRSFGIPNDENEFNTLTMVADDNVSKKKKNLFCQKNQPKLVKSMVIYGPNGAGKTNILNAFNHFLNIIKIHQNYFGAGNILFYLQNNKFISGNAPMGYKIKFINDKKLYLYEILFNNSHVIKFEQLSEIFQEKNELIFSRDEHIIHINNKNYYEKAMIHFQKNRLALPIFSLIGDSKIKEVFNYLCNIENAVLHNQISISQNWIDTFQNNADSINEFLANAQIDLQFKSIQRSANQIGYDLKFEQTTHFREFDKNLNKTIELDYLSELSYGTTLLISLMVKIIEHKNKPCIIMIDELDGRFHIELLKEFLKFIHKQEMVQLIFTSHNQYLLDTDLWRADQITMVRKNIHSQNSEILRISDFDTLRNVKGKYWRQAILNGITGVQQFVEEF